MSTMLADTIKKNYILKQRIAVLERNIQEISITRVSTERTRIQNVIMENKMLSNEKKHEVLAEAEKNRKDPHHREQLMKYCLIMLAGFLLFGLINYL